MIQMGRDRRAGARPREETTRERSSHFSSALFICCYLTDHTTFDGPLLGKQLQAAAQADCSSAGWGLR